MNNIDVYSYCVCVTFHQLAGEEITEMKDLLTKVE